MLPYFKDKFKKSIGKIEAYYVTGMQYIMILCLPSPN